MKMDKYTQRVYDRQGDMIFEGVIKYSSSENIANQLGQIFDMMEDSILYNMLLDDMETYCDNS